jgi:hypothetical protein
MNCSKSGHALGTSSISSDLGADFCFRVATMQISFHWPRLKVKQEDDPPTAPAGAIFMLAGGTAPNGTVIQEPREPRIGTRAYIHNQRNGYPSVEIKFGKGDAFEGKPIIPTLRELAQLISSTIDQLEASCEGS